MHHEPVDVDQVVRHKAVDQLAAAVDEDVLPGLLLQLPDLFCDIALEQCPVPVERLLEASRDHELLELFILTAKLTLRLPLYLAKRPRSSQTSFAQAAARRS